MSTSGQIDAVDLTMTSDPYQNHSYLTSVQIAHNNTLMDQAAAQYMDSRTGPWTSGPPDGDAFLSLPSMVNGSTSIVDIAQAQSADEYLVANTDPTVIAGFEAQRQLLIAALNSSDRAALEVLNFNYGAFSNANMHPFSRGTITVGLLYDSRLGRLANQSHSSIQPIPSTPP